MKIYSIIRYDREDPTSIALVEAETAENYSFRENWKDIKVKRVIINPCNPKYHSFTTSYFRSINYKYLSDKVAEFESDDNAILWFEMECL